MELASILEGLRENAIKQGHKSHICKDCKVALAVAKENDTFVHVRTPSGVELKLLYRGKYYCQMCHTWQ